MIKTIIHRLLERRHFWRYATFSEIAELYASRTMRVIAINIVAGFTSVYLYSEGYSLAFLTIFWVCFYLSRTLALVVANLVISRFGPKHGTLYSNLLYVPAMTALGFLPQLGLPSVIIWAIFASISSSMYQLSYMVDFSKIKNIENAGKELAFMNILEKVAIGLSPVLGGVIALWFGLELVMWIAAVFFMIAALPLFKTPEPIKTRQHMKIAGFPWRANASSFIAHLGKGFDIATTGTIWSLFLVIVIFPGYGWEIYVKLGLLSSVTIITALIASYAYGKVIDKNKGGELLKITVAFNGLVHIMRIFVNSTSSIVATNISNEVATTGYGMAFMRGVFDAADLSGHRIFYLCVADIVQNIGAALAMLLLFTLTSVFEVGLSFKIFFAIAGFFVLLIGVAKFNIYKHKERSDLGSVIY